MLTLQTRSGDTIANMHKAHITRDAKNDGWRIFAGPLTAEEAAQARLQSKAGDLTVLFGDKTYGVTIDETETVTLPGGSVDVRGRFFVPDEPTL